MARKLENNAAGGATAAATSIAGASFTLAALARFTPDLDGAARASLFFALPSSMQVHGLQELDERIRERSARLWDEHTSTPGETP